VQGNKVTVGAPFYNRVAIPVALILLLLTAVGPLLAWRKTSFESLKRNFMWPTAASVAVALFVVFAPTSWGSIFGLKPWVDISYFYSVMTIFLSSLVAFTVASEFHRGGRVIAEKTGQGMITSIVQLTRRNMRRYGGYVVHFGVVLVMIGFSGSALNQEKEAEMGFGDKMEIGNYELICRSYTQDDSPNQASEWALLDVFENGKLQRTMTPQRIFYKASQQPSTKPDIVHGFKEDLYLVYEGQNTKGQPVIKAYVNPMVTWIWIGSYIMTLGTGLALLKNAPARVTALVPKIVQRPAPAAVGGD
jgi:cytochrome c-type biogenesis protein CcmF